MNKERFSEIMKEDGYNQLCADTLWEKLIREKVENSPLPNWIAELMLHITNESLRDFCPLEYLINPEKEDF